MREQLPKALKRAAEAHTNLTMYHAVIALCESGCFYGPHRETDQIITIAKRAADRQLDLYDKATEAAARAALQTPEPSDD